MKQRKQQEKLNKVKRAKYLAEQKIEKATRKVVLVKQRVLFAVEKVKNINKNKELADTLVQLKTKKT